MNAAFLFKWSLHSALDGVNQSVTESRPRLARQRHSVFRGTFNESKTKWGQHLGQSLHFAQRRKYKKHLNTSTSPSIYPHLSLRYFLSWLVEVFDPDSEFYGPFNCVLLVNWNWDFFCVCGLNNSVPFDIFSTVKSWVSLCKKVFQLLLPPPPPGPACEWRIFNSSFRTHLLLHGCFHAKTWTHLNIPNWMTHPNLFARSVSDTLLGWSECEPRYSLAVTQIRDTQARTRTLMSQRHQASMTLSQNSFYALSLSQKSVNYKKRTV